jgi:hypothetical protein
MAPYRKNKDLTLRALADEHWEEAFQDLLNKANPQKLVSPLFGALCSSSPTLRWHAVTCFGHAASRIADNSLERVRIIMRRLLWSLNDESGGIGWGAPESMAEVMSCLNRMADEYHRLLFSFVRSRSGPDNYLEVAPLRQGAYWGIARLGQARPDLLQPFASLLLQGLHTESSPFARGCLCLAFAALQAESQEIRRGLHEALEETAGFSLYWNKQFHRTSVAELARLALNRQEQVQGGLTSHPA